MLTELRPDEIQVEALLLKANVSKGSLYHHFEDFSELLEAAMVMKFAVGVDRDIEMLTQLLVSSSDKESLLNGLHLVTEYSHLPESRTRRFERARILSKSQGKPRLMELLSVEQQRLTDELTDLIYEGQNKGWLSSEIDARSTAVFIQAFTLGRIVNDVTENGFEQDRWTELIDRVVRLALS